jgi:hypothetical protein
MQCPKCESDDVLLCSTAYEQGKSVVKRKGKIEGGMDGGGRITADHESTETVLTEFAKRAAAPELTTNSLWYSLIGAVVAFFVVPSVWHDFTGHNPQWLYFLLLAAIAVAIYRLVTVYKKRRSENDAQKAAWERSWICKRCGTIFDPSEKVPGVTPAE